MATATLEQLRLPRHPGVTITDKKLQSLAAKYHSIPPDKIWYYPEPSNNEQQEPSGDFSSEDVDERTIGEIRAVLRAKAQKKRKKAQGKLLQIKGAKKPKSTKKQRVLTLEPGQRSLLSFIQFEKP